MRSPRLHDRTCASIFPAPIPNWAIRRTITLRALIPIAFFYAKRISFCALNVMAPNVESTELPGIASTGRRDYAVQCLLYIRGVFCSQSPVLVYNYKGIVHHYRPYSSYSQLLFVATKSTSRDRPFLDLNIPVGSHTLRKFDRQCQTRKLRHTLIA